MAAGACTPSLGSHTEQKSNLEKRYLPARFEVVATLPRDAGKDFLYSMRVDSEARHIVHVGSDGLYLYQWSEDFKSVQLLDKIQQVPPALSHVGGSLETNLNVPTSTRQTAVGTHAVTGDDAWFTGVADTFLKRNGKRVTVNLVRPDAFVSSHEEAHCPTKIRNNRFEVNGAECVSNRGFLENWVPQSADLKSLLLEGSDTSIFDGDEVQNPGEPYTTGPWGFLGGQTLFQVFRQSDEYSSSHHPSHQMIAIDPQGEFSVINSEVFGEGFTWTSSQSRFWSIDGQYLAFVNGRMAVLRQGGKALYFGEAMKVGDIRFSETQDPTRGLVGVPFREDGRPGWDLQEFSIQDDQVTKRTIYTVPVAHRGRTAFPSIAATGEIVVFKDQAAVFLNDDGSVDFEIPYSMLPSRKSYVKMREGTVAEIGQFAMLDNDHLLAMNALSADYMDNAEVGEVYKITRPSPAAQARCKSGNGQVLSVGEAWREVPDLPWESIQEVWGRGGFVFGTYLNGGGQLSFQVREPRETIKEGEKDYRVIESDTGEVLSITGAIAIRAGELPGTPSSEAKLYVKSVGSSHVLVCTDPPRSR